MANVHDNVLTLLGSVARGNREISADKIISRLSPDGVPHTSGVTVAARDVMDEVLQIVMTFDPTTVVTSTPPPSTAVTLPASAAAAICDSLREGALNSVKYAPNAQRRCDIIVNSNGRLDSFTIRYTDGRPRIRHQTDTRRQGWSPNSHIRSTTDNKRRNRRHRIDTGG